MTVQLFLRDEKEHNKKIADDFAEFKDAYRQGRLNFVKIERRGIAREELYCELEPDSPWVDFLKDEELRNNIITFFRDTDNKLSITDIVLGNEQVKPYIVFKFFYDEPM